MFVRASGEEVRARELAEGDELASGWSYPVEYEVPDAEEYAGDVRGKTWNPAVVVRAIETGERGPLYGASVKETKSYYLTFGAQSRAQE